MLPVSNVAAIWICDLESGAPIGSGLDFSAHAPCDASPTPLTTVQEFVWPGTTVFQPGGITQFGGKTSRPESATVKLWSTGVAARKLTLPIWLAVTLHVPATPVNEIVAPFTPPDVQTPVAPKVTVNPDVLDAATTKGASVVSLFESGLNVMVCDA